MATVCPRDATPLTSTPDVFGPGKSALVCGKCSGVFVKWETAKDFFTELGLSLNELHTLVEKAAARSGNGEVLACTSCGKANLRPLTFKGVELDLCESCGSAWFDRGELQRISGGKFGGKVATEAVQTGKVVGVFEMWWDCAHCDTKGLLGASNRFCPNCGAQQDAGSRYFPPAGKEQAANHEYDGADRACPACNTPNGAKAHNCRSCGSPLDGAAQVGRVADQSSAQPRKGAPAAAVKPKMSTGKIVAIVASVVGALLLLCCGLSMWTKEVQLTVTSHKWERSIDIERYSAQSDSAWCDSMPSGAYSVSRSREQRGSHKVADGETCSTRNVDRGNGTFERREECHTKYRDVPDYDDRCHFTIDRWSVNRSVKLDDTGTTPEWPVVSGLRTGNSLGSEREGAHHEKYELLLKGEDGKNYDCSLSEAKWVAVKDGLKKKIPVGVITSIPECDKL
jgi:hypothetical protein